MSNPTQRQSPVELWDRAWRSRTAYAGGHHEPIIAAITRSLGTVAARTILEVGAGSARDSLHLAELGATVVAFDFSHAALRHAAEGMAQRGLSLQLAQGNAFALPFPDQTFDLVFSQGLMEHFPDPLPLVQEQLRVLRVQGLLLIDVPQTYTLYTLHKKRLIQQGQWFAGWETSYTLTQLEQLMHTAGLTVVGSYGSGYYPALLLGLRNLHTFDQRHRLPVQLPETLRRAVERIWTTLEHQRWYYRWMWNIGVVAQKQAG